jgi:hypothetical protein
MIQAAVLTASEGGEKLSSGLPPVRSSLKNIAGTFSLKK